MGKIKISAVSYLNTVPFIYGIEKDKALLDQIHLSKDIPSECARKLIDNEVDLGLVPVATLLKLDSYALVSDYCIGSIGKVKSVLLVSDVPLNEIKSIFLDYQSRTSVLLCQVLCKRFWNIDVDFLPSKEGYEELIQGNQAGVIIGDRTFNLPRTFNYTYDLSEEWHKWKGLPFVFASWVSNKKLDQGFLNQFNQALKIGIENKEKSIVNLPNQKLSFAEQKSYISENINYHFNDKMKTALSLFLDEARKLQIAS